MKQAEETAPPSRDVPGVVEHLFRHGGQDGGDLDPFFGLEHLTLAEDVVPEALAPALRTWPFYGVPENPLRLDQADFA